MDVELRAVVDLAAGPLVVVKAEANGRRATIVVSFIVMFLNV